MKQVKSIFFFLILLAGVIACGETEEINPVELAEAAPEMAQPESPTKQATAARTSALYTDWSGQVTVQVVAVTYPYQQYHTQRQAEIDEDFVLVGGGAYVDYKNGYGALLTECGPNQGKTAWVASSKDHGHVNHHDLTVYAIGLRINGLSSDQLRSHLAWNSRSTTGNYPTTNAPVPSGYRLIGGGARLESASGAGVLLTASYPAAEKWFVGAKDHGWSGTGTLTSWAVGIKEYIPGFGYLDIVNSNPQSKYIGSGPDTQTLSTPSGWVNTSVGAYERWNAPGRLLSGIVPNTANSVTAYSKDQLYGSSGTLSVYAIRIRKRP